MESKKGESRWAEDQRSAKQMRPGLGALYATRNDPRPQMIPKIDLNTTQNDPRLQMITKFFHTRPEMIPEELSEWNGMTFNSRRCMLELLK